MEEQERGQQPAEEAGQKGGAMEARIGATYQAVVPEVEPTMWVHWGPAILGAVVAVAIAIVLNTLGGAVGLRLPRIGIGGVMAYWMIASAAVGLFFGSYLASKAVGAKTQWMGLMYGLLVWAIVVTFDFVMMGLFGSVPRFMQPLITMRSPVLGEIASGIIAASAWWFFVGYMIALLASALGGVIGTTTREEP